MTVLLACQFEDGAVIVADSRATWLAGSRATPQDSLQKILFLGKGSVFAFAGDVRLASIIAKEIESRVRKDPRWLKIEKMAGALPRISRAFYQQIPRVDTSVLLIAGTNVRGQVEIRWLESPRFECQKLTEPLVVFGSGRGVKAAMAKHINGLGEDADLKQRANRIWVALENELEAIGVGSVGGLLQIAILSPNKAQAMTHGSLTLDPDQPPSAKAMRMEKGRWIQEGTAAGIVPLMSPVALLRGGVTPMKVHDYVVDPAAPEPKWHLTYMLTCFRVEQSVGDIEFSGLWAQGAILRIPAVVRTVVALGAWGAEGEVDVEVYFIDGEGRALVHQEGISFDALPVERDFRLDVTLPIRRAGAAFIEIEIGGKILGRRGVYFRLVDAVITSATESERATYLRSLPDRLLAEHRECEDPEIEAGGPPLLVYHTMCQNCEAQGMVLRFEKQVAAIYSRTYPMRFRIFVASSFRAARGEHQARLELRHAEQTERVVLGSTMNASSSCIAQQVHGEFVVELPIPGWYYLNFVVDDHRVGTVLFAAETDNPTFSYNLMPEDLKRVSAGEIHALVRRTPNEDGIVLGGD